MGINLNSRIIADARLAGIHGGKLAGGYALRISVEFDVRNWDEGEPPDVVMGPARVDLQGKGGLLLGLAFPETIQPFTVSKYACKRSVHFDLLLSQPAMETVERHRDGQGVSLNVKLHAEVRRAGQTQVAHDDVRGDFNVAHWIAALEQAGYGRSLLFEVPIPSEHQALGSVLEMLEAARRLLAQGHYPDAVAKCRVVIEGLTTELGQTTGLRAALAQSKQDRSLEQRELVMRQAAMDFASLAVHAKDVPINKLFDRNAAQMMLGTTAALVSSAMVRQTSGQRRP
jgi:hypothetical protein